MAALTGGHIFLLPNCYGNLIFSTPSPRAEGWKIWPPSERNNMNKIATAIKYLQDNNPCDEEIFVGFSGGKDSVVIARLVEMSGLNYQLFYAATGIDPPEIVEFIRNYYECTFLKPNKTFWYSLLTHNPPARFSRWCCKNLKKQPLMKVPHYHRVLGIRAEESWKRAQYPQNNLWSQGKKKQMLHYPILDWNEADIGSL